MPRPRKYRKVCCLPDNDGFVPVRGGEELTPIVLNVDEYEAIRLIDREGFSQEQCGEYMRIARTTVQQIYATTRKKLADALVEGLANRGRGFYTLQRKQRSLRVQKLLSEKNPSDAFETLHRVGLCPGRKRWTAQGSETR